MRAIPIPSHGAHVTYSRPVALLATTALAAASLLTAPIAAAAASQSDWLVVNEVDTDNTELSGGSDADWVEVYNPTAADIDLGGYTILDAKDKDAYEVPAGTVVAAGGYLVIDEFEFGLGKSDAIRVFDPVGTLVVEQTWDVAEHGPSIGRRVTADGVEFVHTSEATPGAENRFPEALVVLNEVVYDDAVTGLEDTIELYNAGAATADLSGWTVSDRKAIDDGDVAEMAHLPTGTTLAPGEFLVLVNEVDFGFGLGKGDEVVLRDASGAEVDVLGYENTSPTFDWARCPDGTGQWAPATTATPGAANDCSTPEVEAAVLLNEVDSSPADWVELVNPGTEAIELDGYELRDNSDDHRWRFAAGTVLAAGGLLVVDADSAGLVLDGDEWTSGRFDEAIGIGSADRIRLYDPEGTLVDETDAWTAHPAIDGSESAATWARCPDGVGEFLLAAATKGASNAGACIAPSVVINEINSRGGPDDWAEVVNTGATPVDISGWYINDNSPRTAGEVTPVADGTVLAPGDRYVFTELVDFDFGLGDGDSVVLYTAWGLEVARVDYPAHPAGFWARCPDGSGELVDVPTATPGAANACDGEVVDPELPETGESAAAWPGPDEVTVLDTEPMFLEDGSGLDTWTDDTGTWLYAIDNGTGRFWKLSVDAEGGVAFAAGWEDGKRIRYAKDAGDPSAKGPDTEGITVDGDGFVYAAAERDNAAKGVNFDVVLKVDPSAPGPDLVALEEWDLTALLPAVDANLGIEAVEWVSDADLAGRLWDGARDAVYDPSAYPGHGGGLFFVAVEDNGHLYAFALSDGGAAQLVAEIDPGQPATMSLDWDAVRGTLWAVCDDGCENTLSEVRLNGTATPQTTLYAAPAGLEVGNHEGFATAPASLVADGARPVWWFQDGVSQAALRTGALTTFNAVSPVTTADLTSANRGSVLLPASVSPGERVTVRVPQLAGRTVEVWMHSEPTRLFAGLVDSSGEIAVTVPASIAGGAHHVVVLEAGTANVLGWASATVVADDASTLARTGFDPAPAVAVAALLLLGGAALMLRRRRAAI